MLRSHHAIPPPAHPEDGRYFALYKQYALPWPDRTRPMRESYPRPLQEKAVTLMLLQADRSSCLWTVGVDTADLLLEVSLRGRSMRVGAVAGG